MNPTLWRNSSSISLRAFSSQSGIAAGYLSECERGVKSASGRVVTAYFEHSNGKVTPSDFKKIRAEWLRKNKLRK